MGIEAARAAHQRAEKALYSLSKTRDEAGDWLPAWIECIDALRDLSRCGWALALDRQENDVVSRFVQATNGSAEELVEPYVSERWSCEDPTRRPFLYLQPQGEFAKFVDPQLDVIDALWSVWLAWTRPLYARVA